MVHGDKGNDIGFSEHLAIPNPLFVESFSSREASVRHVPEPVVVDLNAQLPTDEVVSRKMETVGAKVGLAVVSDQCTAVLTNSLCGVNSREPLGSAFVAPSFSGYDEVMAGFFADELYARG